MRILRARDRVSSPWKNSGGVTAEIAVFPPGAGFDDFGWRVSAAHVAKGGPFSTFPGIDRTLAVLRGRMALTIAGMGRVEMSSSSAPLAFPGDAATEARLLDGPVEDLNVMTRRGAYRARVTRGGRPSSDADVTLLYLLTDTKMPDGTALSISDVVQIAHSDATALSPDADFYRIEIFATV